MQSLWSDSVEFPKFNSLREDIKTDVLIIGGGITGILCAHMLKMANVNYALVEASSICNGITKNTTAKITAQHGLCYDKLIQDVGVKKAGEYLRANLQAVEQFRKLCSGIDCDFEEQDAYVFSTHNMEVIKREKEALDTLGYPVKFETSVPLPFPISGAVKFSNQAQFHPLRFASAISQDLSIYESTMVKGIAQKKVITDSGSVTADKIIVATHFPFMNKYGSYFLKMFQERSYVIAVENAGDVKGMYIQGEKNGISLRNFDNLLLVGGGGHRTGQQGGGYRELEEFIRAYFPRARERYRWSTQDCMTLDSIPYIGAYSKNTIKHTPKVYVATGFNKWGMSTSMVAAQILSDMVQDKINPYAEVFSPSRSMLKKQLWLNGVEAAKNMVTLKKPRCPHMGCALQWNRAEMSWDCPCHGSRFSESGELLDNPSVKSLKTK